LQRSRWKSSTSLTSLRIPSFSASASGINVHLSFHRSTIHLSEAQTHRHVHGLQGASGWMVR
jgi:hypothetical protein